ncbi:ATP-binding protein [Mycolicibacterium sphagni]|uniref:histidine kinase n=1 Tax=Mycolicibacterium sphagni TaxID=1786 RepID=A0A255DGR8_9MYCO|nr:ATP-binding protein [Mycolicibacterium sphagni]OYN76152.1 hypothetical protein CG716_22630 [Mycolicibacterium sphagni]
MDLFILIATFFANFMLGLLVLLRDAKSGMARSFILLCVFIDIWLVANFITNHALDIAINVAANKLAFVSAYSILLSAVLFTFFFPHRRDISRRRAWVLSSVAVIALLFSATDAVTGTVIQQPGGVLDFSVGPLLWLYVVGALFFFGFIAWNLSARHDRDKRESAQAHSVLVAFLLTAALVMITNGLLPLVGLGWGATRFSPLATVILVGAISYLIARRGLFDIRSATVRTLSYAASLLTLSVVFYSIAYLISATVLNGDITKVVDVNPIAIILVVGFAFALAFQPTKRFFDTVTDGIFYRDQYKVEDFFARFGEVLTTTDDLRNLLQSAATELATTLKLDQVFFWLHPEEGVIERHLAAGTPGHPTLTSRDIAMLDDYAAGASTSLVNPELLGDQHRALRKLLHQNGIAVVMPLRHRDTTFGYVALGNRLSGTYTDRDRDTLAGATNELVIAIQNALSLREVKAINATLEERIALATKQLRRSNAKLRHLDEVKDEFMSMASHQLRTPLAGVKGNLSMVLEGDMGPLFPKQEQVLRQAFTSSDRMAGLVSDFLNVSRIQTGKFVIEKAPFDLHAAVKEEIDLLKPIAATHQMTLQFNVDGDDFAVTADESKLRQVVMNFVDNAIYYSHPNSTITINLVRTKGAAMLTVVDTGIGVPKAEQARLFKKFFRAKNARTQRPDGTGVGLFLAQKVIASHHGSLIFHSEENKGSTFGFRLPTHPHVAGHTIERGSASTRE